MAPLLRRWGTTAAVVDHCYCTLHLIQGAFICSSLCTIVITMSALKDNGTWLLLCCHVLIANSMLEPRVPHRLFDPQSIPTLHIRQLYMPTCDAMSCPVKRLRLHVGHVIQSVTFNPNLAVMNRCVAGCAWQPGCCTAIHGGMAAWQWVCAYP